VATVGELPRDVEPLLQAGLNQPAARSVEAPDPVRERIARELDSNMLLQYGFSKAARLSRAGQLEEAATEYGKLSAAAGKPELRALALVLRAEMLMRDPPTVFDPTAAREALEQAHGLGPPEREWRFTLGILALREDRLAEARELLVRSFTADHQPQEAAAYLAVVDARLGDAAAGRQWLELARERGDSWRSPEAEIALRFPSNPARALREAAADHPEEYWLRLALARELSATGRHDELVEVTRSLADDTDVPERLRAVAALGAARTLLLHAGDDRLAEAMTLAAQARTLAPKALSVWEILALGLCRQGRYRRAAAAARRLIKADPGLATPYYVRAWALGALGGSKRCAAAAQALDEGVERDPDWPLRANAKAAATACR
jgi:tetratricopeptide (TPR) repeat protein